MRNLMFNVATFFTGSNKLLDNNAPGNKPTTGNYTTTDQVVNGFVNLVRYLLGPIFTIIGIAATVYAIYLGVMYAKAESAEKRKEVQGRLIGACIGAVIIIAGATLCYALNWGDIFKNFTAPSGNAGATV